MAGLTPLRMKRWLKKRVLEGDSPPPRAVHSLVLRPKSMLAQAPSRGWKVEYFREYEGPTQRRSDSEWEWSAGVGASSSR